ncbi:hypothetical protein Q1695_008023 [Nippostrongylus brasiliensis]|nr:hypothetical protein Q1695_008023 [Nippostrongylus brasiliensis]
MAPDRGSAMSCRRCRCGEAPEAIPQPDRIQMPSRTIYLVSVLDIGFPKRKLATSFSQQESSQYPLTYTESSSSPRRRTQLCARRDHLVDVLLRSLFTTLCHVPRS